MAGRSPMLPIRKSLYAIGIFLVLSLPQFSFSQANQNRSSDHDLKTTLAAGRSTFNSFCAGCHGLDGRGSNKAVNISTSSSVQNLSDRQLLSIISDGIAGTDMPAFHGLTEKQARTVVDYLRSLQGRVERSTLPGDAKRGKKIFFGKGDCSSCHTVSGQGGFLGPDLTNYGISSSVSTIRNEIIKSPRVPPFGYRTAVVTTATGDRLAGLLRNEDNFSVQLQTRDGSFHLLQKAELQKIDYLESSLMPTNYRDQLSDSEVKDLVSYLMTAPDITSAAVTVSGQETQSFKLEPRSPKFLELISSNAKLETVATGFGFTEGPMWDPAGFIYISDEKINKIFRVYPNGKKEEVIALGDPDGNTFDRQHRLIDCASLLRAVIEVRPNGKYKVLADHYHGKRFNSPNDVTVGPDGALYFTDPTLDLVAGEKQELPFQGVYRLDDGGNLRLLTRDLTQPNGLAFSPDGKEFYVDDSEQRNIRVYDVTAQGTLHNGRIFGEEPGGKNDGVPDGIKVDEKGNLFVTGPKGIWVWDANGNHLGTIVMPEQPANLAWGDPQYSTLYIAATTSVYRLETKTRGFVPHLQH